MLSTMSEKLNRLKPLITPRTIAEAQAEAKGDWLAGRLILGKSGPLRPATAAAVRAVMQQSADAGCREAPDVGAATVPVRVIAPKIDALINSCCTTNAPVQ